MKSGGTILFGEEKYEFVTVSKEYLIELEKKAKDSVNLLAEIEVLKRRLENAVEVVRCKECRWHGAKMIPRSVRCIAWHKADDFCSYGEREGE